MYSVPTAEEMINLRETQELFKSNLFRMQVRLGVWKVEFPCLVVLRPCPANKQQIAELLKEVAFNQSKYVREAHADVGGLGEGEDKL